jgi:hypothetical protein
VEEGCEEVKVFDEDGKVNLAFVLALTFQPYSIFLLSSEEELNKLYPQHNTSELCQICKDIKEKQAKPMPARATGIDLTTSDQRTTQDVRERSCAHQI